MSADQNYTYFAEKTEHGLYPELNTGHHIVDKP